MKTRTKVILAVLTLIGVVSCANLVPRQGWSRSLGPVVPHDSFPADCSICHESGSWDRIKPDFQYDHLKETGFALDGAHADATCLMCHNDRGPVKQFADKGCRGCHEDVHRGRQGVTCQDCHDQDTWRPTESIALHSRTRFPLVGAHAAAECTDCHAGAKNNNFEAVSVACDTCHANDFTRTTVIDHAAMGFTTDCQRCHNPTGWKPADFDHPATFPLTNGHGGVSCDQCHTTPGVFTGLTTSCVSCHQPDFNATTDPAHVSAGFSTDCTQCHNTSQWQGALYTHTTAFPLSNGHAGRRCSDCHSGGVYTGLSSDCASCHLDTFQATTNPNHTAAGFGTGCTLCHNTTRWRGATFAHPATFPLTNGHANQSCSNCHTTPNVFTGLSTNCVSCHQDDYNGTTDPAHAAAGFSTTCTQCHNTTRWQGANFTHTSTFPLSNGHANVACVTCHTTPGVYTGLNTDCASCHLPDFQGTTDPNHVTSGFGTNCTQCHNTSQWQGATFNHPATFPLTNAHNASCTQCHTTPGVYTGLSTTCVSCHQTDYNQTADPAHAAAGIGTNCTQCHNTVTWQGAQFTHTAAFPLSNGHASRTCNECHTTPGVYTGQSPACAACHTDDYQRVTNPNHVTGGFAMTCLDCHNTSQWQGAAFQHTPTFPLSNGHSNVSCTRCHTTPGVYTGLNTACLSCHQTDFNTTTNPNHVTAGFGTNCTQCHNTSQWLGATFNHPPAFPLTNAHNTSCSQCHTTPNVYTGLNTACVSCHQTDYNSTADPAHAAAGIGTNCTQCHNTTTWQGAVFTHTAAFPLTNAHANRACNACHTTPGVYSGLSNACVTCHQTDYNQTTNPNHTAAGYSTTCTQCHNTSTWLGAVFSHPPSFPLTNGHANRTCNQCHTTPGVYTGQSAACSACHLDDYQATTDPYHAAAGISTTCTQCHNTAQWPGATYTHTAAFPLTNAHANRACGACHTTPATYQGLTGDCAQCHMPDYTSTTNPNHAQSGFPTTCAQCHTTSAWDPSTFNHPRINRGDHSNLRCIDCHTVPSTTPAFSCTHCHEHNQQDTGQDHQGVNNYQWLSSACYNCHD